MKGEKKSDARMLAHLISTPFQMRYNDAQLGRINVFYHEASGGKYVPRTVFFEPGMIGAVRASPLGELFCPDNLVN
jgi:tubulin beta